MDKVTVLLVDDHLVVRQGLRAILSTAPDIEVIGEASDGFEALEKAKEHQPQVILMDLHMPNMDGLEATRLMKKELPSSAVIVLTIYDNEAYVVEAIKAGAGGYLLKDASKDLLIHTIRAVNSGGTLVRKSLLHEAFHSLESGVNHQKKDKGAGDTRVGTLSSRERDVLRLVIQGQTNKQIGHALCISEDTVKKHVQNLMLKLGVSDRTQAAVEGVRASLIPHFVDEEL